jgi:hypothetical protein
VVSVILFHDGLFLKCAPPKGTLPNFERNRWRSGVDKISAIEEADEASTRGFEICCVSWACQVTNCVHSQLFCVTCQTKTEAKPKILTQLKEMDASVITKQNSMGEMISFVNFDFETVKQAEGQESYVLTDVAN